LNVLRGDGRGKKNKLLKKKKRKECQGTVEQGNGNAIYSADAFKGRKREVSKSFLEFCQAKNIERGKK